VCVGYFEEVTCHCQDAKEACNWVTNQVLATLKERKIDLAAFPIAASALGELIAKRKAMGLNTQRAREVYAHMLEHGSTAAAAIKALGFEPVGDQSQLAEMVRRAIAANPKAVADYKKGKTKAADAIKGAIMRETKGLANMEVVQRLVLEELQKE
jgi:aspartyl-tRNA(Asn)/glutamyl-tRNA(Gln) amidotransferase subunit B